MDASDTKFKLTRKHGMYVLVFLGLCGLVYESISVSRILPTTGWETTTGKVKKSRYIKRNAPSRSLLGRPRSVYAPVVIYKYTVDGQNYTNRRVSIWEKKDFGSKRQRDPSGKLKRYPKGMDVTVYYNPANPEEAILEKSLPWTVYAGIMGSFVLLFLGIGGALSSGPPPEEQEPESTCSDTTVVQEAELIEAN
ncbi:MAG: DUF3592 domain-containing protein [Planctomycetales bacterium]|nr:DUF3592 domain-containing protein [Planctomycetales bacterium]